MGLVEQIQILLVVHKKVGGRASATPPPCQEEHDWTLRSRTFKDHILSKFKDLTHEQRFHMPLNTVITQVLQCFILSTVAFFLYIDSMNLEFTCLRRVGSFQGVLLNNYRLYELIDTKYMHDRVLVSEIKQDCARSWYKD